MADLGMDNTHDGDAPDYEPVTPTTRRTPPPAAPKKKPGRPRKKAALNKIEVKGIQNQPSNHTEDHPDQYVFEIMYDEPEVLQEFFLLVKDNEASFLEFQVGPSSLKIKTVKGHGTLVCYLPGKAMNYFYAAEPMMFNIKAAKLFAIWSTICEDTISSLTIAINRHQIGNTISLISINARGDYREDECNIVVIPSKVDVEKSWALLADFIKAEKSYDIDITYVDGDFKSLLNGCSKLGSKNLEYMQQYGEPLVARYRHQESMTQSSVYYARPELRSIVSRISPGEIFALTLTVEDIIKVGTKLGAKTVRISLHRDRGMILTKYIIDVNASAAKGDGYNPILDNRGYIKFVYNPSFSEGDDDDETTIE